LSDFKSECRGQPLEIVIGAGDSLIQWLILPKLAAIEVRLPLARHTFLNLTNAEINHRLHEGLIDFGIMRKGEVTKPLGSAPLGPMAFSLFVPRDMQVAFKVNSFSEIIGKLPLAILEGEGRFRQELSAIARKRKLRLNIKVECSSFPLVARALGSGTLAGILPCMAADELRKLGLVEISTKALLVFEREVCLAWNPRRIQVRAALGLARGIWADTLRCSLRAR
jgi:DNA-binding transcriptional LysR family regulator